MGSQSCQKGGKSSLNECNNLTVIRKKDSLILLLGLGQTVFPDFIGIKIYIQWRV
jgi:hypothetical protein